MKKANPTKAIKTIKIKTDEINPVDVELIAESIKAVADNFSKALDSGLTKRAICLLIHDAIPGKSVTMTDIEKVLIWGSNLRKYVTK